MNIKNINVLAISETHLDNSFDAIVAIHDSRIYRTDRNANGGGVAMYVQSRIPFSLKEDLMSDNVEVIWLQVLLPHLKPIVVGNCYIPPSAKSPYLDNV
jgi:hypothetical protein